VRRRIAEFFDSNILVLNTPCTTKQIAGFANGRGDEVRDLGGSAKPMLSNPWKSL
jgi:hypothetical protein